jgi:hypothetical protein
MHLEAEIKLSSAMHLQAEIEGFGDAFGGRDRAGLEMRLEAEIE